MKPLHILVLFVALSQVTQAQWFDKQSLSCTVLIEKYENSSFVPHGTGFVLWNYADPTHPIVVTAGHLLNRSELYISVNADSALLSYSKYHKLDTLRGEKLSWVLAGHKLRAKVHLVSKPSPTFVVDDSLDIGVFLIDLATGGVLPPKDSIRFADFQLIPRSNLRLRKEVSLGDELFFVGFPFGLGTVDRNEPIIRSGSVAWLSPSSSEYLLDAYSFGGNSGSPVFSKIILGRQPGVIDWDSAFLVGMIVGHFGEKIEGVLLQPNPQAQAVNRVTLETQNYGLARCIWIDDILHVIEKAKGLRLPE